MADEDSDPLSSGDEYRPAAKRRKQNKPKPKKEKKKKKPSRDGEDAQTSTEVESSVVSAATSR